MSWKLYVPPTDEAPRPRAAHDLGQKVKAAIACGLAVAILSAIIASVLVLSGGDLVAWLWCLAASAVIGAVVTCYFVFVWSRNVADREWRLEDAARKQQQRTAQAAEKKLEEAAERAHNRIVNEEDDDGNPATLSDVQRLHLVALEIIDRFYRLGQPVTREAMTEEGICTQPQWNLVNRVMLAVGLKTKRRMREDLDFGEAWQLWRSTVSVEDGYIWILDGRGNRKALEQV